MGGVGCIIIIWRTRFYAFFCFHALLCVERWRRVFSGLAGWLAVEVKEVYSRKGVELVCRWVYVIELFCGGFCVIWGLYI